MIHSFSCKNFYSFHEISTVNFVVNEKAPINNGYFKASSEARLSKVEVVIGPNASGKTNLLKALPFLKWLISNSFSIHPNASLPVKPYLFNKQKAEPSELDVTFEVNGDIYEYSFLLNETRILKEELKVKNKTKQKVTSKLLFSRFWDNNIGQYALKDKHFNLPKGLALRTNSSVIESALRLNHQQSQKIANYWQHVETNVIEAGWIGDHLLPSAQNQLIEVLDFYSEDENKALKEEAEKLLTRFDLGLESFSIQKEKRQDGLSINIKVAHLINGKKEYLPMQYESSGTKQLFILLKTILLVLGRGGIAVLDEFDVNLHPEVISALFELFIQPETNPKNAQILFSTHSHLIMSKLDKYQIIFAEKNSQGESECWRLDEMSGVRADESYYSKYIAGTYGAVPKL